MSFIHYDDKIGEYSVDLRAWLIFQNTRGLLTRNSLAQYFQLAPMPFAKGSNGSVYSARRRLTKFAFAENDQPHAWVDAIGGVTKLAVKIAHPSKNIIASLIEIETLERLRSTKCNYVVKYYGVLMTEDGRLAIVMRRYKQTLYDTLLKRQPLNLSKTVADLFDAVSCLHKSGIVHRDITLKNILVTSDNNHNLNIVIADFGASRRCRLDENEQYNMDKQDITYSSNVCTLAYSCPAMFESPRSYTKTCDTWAIGVIALELCIGEPLFYSLGKQIPLKNPIAAFELKIAAFVSCLTVSNAFCYRTFQKNSKSDVITARKDMTVKLLQLQKVPRLLIFDILRTMGIWENTSSSSSLTYHKPYVLQKQITTDSISSSLLTQKCQAPVIY